MQDPGFAGERPFWWKNARIESDQSFASPPPARVDTVVIGAGAAGLSAALHLASEGIETCVLDAGQVGGGASSRNFGSLGAAVTLRYARNAATFGPEVAAERAKEDINAFRCVLDFLRTAPDACGLQATGCVFAALNEAQVRGLASALEASRHLDFEPAEILSRDALREHVRTDAYSGGLFLADAAEIDPGRYVEHLTQSVRAAGASLHSQRAVNHIDGEAGALRVVGDGFSIAARRAIVATNGYSNGLGGQVGDTLRRDLVPVQANMIATAELPQDQITLAFAKPTMLSDMRRNFYCLRLSPDRKRILFASRTGKRMSAETRARMLSADILGLFPQLGRFDVEFSWSGMIAMTRDRTPHAFVKDGVGYVAGCNGSGMVRHFYLGRQIAHLMTRPASMAKSQYATPVPQLPPLLPKAAAVAAVTALYDTLDRRAIAKRESEACLERKLRPSGPLRQC